MSRETIVRETDDRMITVWIAVKVVLGGTNRSIW